jgi:hypothetical protein
MFYDFEPVYHDPPSNNWFGMQAWGMERWAEYYYLTKDSRVRTILDKWVTWVSSKVTTGTGGAFSIPSTLSWSGQPDTWNAASPGANASLHVSVVDSSTDVGVAAALVKALLYYAAGTGNTAAQTLGKSLLDAVAAHTDTIGITTAETRTDYSRFTGSVFVPTGWTGKMPNGDTVAPGATFLSIRSFYQKDPNFAKVQTYLNGGAAPSFNYHRFWAQADIAMALALYSELFLGGSSASPSVSATASATASASASASPSRSVSPSASPSPTGGGAAVTATYHIDNDWGSGFVATVTVKNNGTTPISSWRVTWVYAGNQHITNSWNATVTQSGATVTAANANYNGTIAPGATASFGFQGTYSGTDSPPTLSASGS